MKIEQLRRLVTDETWRQCIERAKNEEVIEVLQALFDHILSVLSPRIDDIRVEDGRAISFFSDDREFLTVNITRSDLRIYIHPSARASFDPAASFPVEKFRFWTSSFQKSSGRYRAMSVWISGNECIEGVKGILGGIAE